MMALFTFVVTLTTAAVAQPGLYSDQGSIYAERAKIARARNENSAMNDQLARIEQRSAETQRLIWGFIRSHDGLKPDAVNGADAVCIISVPNCADDDCDLGNRQKARLSQLQGQTVSIQSCELNLVDDLSCTVQRHLDFDKKQQTGLDAYCYDRYSNPKPLYYPSASAKNRGVKERRAR